MSSRRSFRGFNLLYASLAVLSVILPGKVSAGEYAATAFVGKVMTDWEGSSVFFHDAPYPVRMFIHASGIAGFDGDAMRALCSAYRVSILVDGKKVPRDQIRTSLQFADQDRTQWCAVTVTMKSGKWPEGYVVLGGSFNGSKLRELGLPPVRLFDSHKQIRFTCKRIGNTDDQLLRLRYEVARLMADHEFIPWDPVLALKATEKLLNAFPEDCYGHASAGYLLETTNGRADAAIEHYSRVIDSIKDAFPRDPPFWLAIQMPGTVKATAEYRKLRFNLWQGARGPVAITGLLSRNIKRLKRGDPAKATEEGARARDIPQDKKTSERAVRASLPTEGGVKPDSKAVASGPASVRATGSPRQDASSTLASDIPGDSSELAAGASGSAVSRAEEPVPGSASGSTKETQPKKSLLLITCAGICALGLGAGWLLRKRKSG